MTDPLILSDELLDQLEDRWRRQGAPVAGHLQPGRPVEEIVATLSTVGLSATEEALTWWSWHDGARQREVVPAMRFLSVAQAVAETLRTRQTIAAAWADVPDVLPEDVWDPAWLMWLMGARSHAAIACDGSPVSPVYHFRNEEPSIGTHPVGARSIGEVVGWWIEAIDGGALYYASDSPTWRTNFELLPPDRRESGLM